MKTNVFAFGPWHIECAPADGGRIYSLRYDGIPLLCEPAPADTGATNPFERRGFYGYDDCFPSVDECPFPIAGMPPVPDHGEICWLPMDLQSSADPTASLAFSVQSKLYPVRFTRTMVFLNRQKLSWRFRIENTGRIDLPCMHVMHALMPLKDVTAMAFAEFGEAVEESANTPIPVKSGPELAKFLLSAPEGYGHTLLLRDLKSGQVDVSLRAGPTVRMTFDSKLLPTLAIWWCNGAGAPGMQYWQCAFEPAAGTWSSLAKSHADGKFWTVPAGKSMDWTIDWEMI